MIECDVLLYNRIGPGFTFESAKQALGGSELEIVQIAHGLAERGHKVAVANGVGTACEQEGVLYVPYRDASGARCHALYIERCSPIDLPEPLHANRIVVRATDIYFHEYDRHKQMLSSGAAALVGVSKWQADQFSFAKERHIIPPILGPTPKTERVPGRFVYASAPCKGMEPTLALWSDMWIRYPRMHSCKLLVITPGYATGDMPASSKFLNVGIEFLGAPDILEYRRLIASAEGVFMVSTMAETFCCVAAFAERSGTRTHILCRDGRGGIPEALMDTDLVTVDLATFEASFLACLGSEPRFSRVVDRSPAALLPEWERVLELGDRSDKTASSAPSVPSVPSVPGPDGGSQEAQLPDEGPLNLEPLSPYFGEFLSALRSELRVGGSELGLGVTLFSLAVSIRAATIVEVGRFKGFSTLALASALRFCDEGWDEPKGAQQRPDVDYGAYHAPKKRVLVSIDPHPTKAATELIARHDLGKWVAFTNQRSDDVILKGQAIDLLLLDGDHTEEALKRDVARFVPYVRAGGYVVLHDYYGWYDAKGNNGSPIKRVCDVLEKQGLQHLLIDTGYASFMVFRKGAIASAKAPTKIPPRTDGKPTIGLVILAKNENPIVARAINSCRSWVDAVTVVVDSETSDGTAELCEALGAEVHVRPWAGSLAATRNEALTIAEQRTDYMLVCDADDAIEGTRPGELSHDCYELMIHDGGVTYPRGQLLKSRTGFRYRGCDRDCAMAIPHEFLFRPGATVGRATSLIYRRLGSVRGVSGWQDQAGAREKYLRHARMLLHHHIDHPEDTRTLYYLGQSYMDASCGTDHALMREAREWYRKRQMAGGWDEEAWFAAFRAAELTEKLGEDPATAYQQAFNMRPTRAEPLVSLAVWYRDDKRRQYNLAYQAASAATKLEEPKDALFVNTSLYQWVARAELGLAAFYCGKRDEAIQVFHGLRTSVPPEQRRWVEEQLVRMRGAVAA